MPYLNWPKEWLFLSVIGNVSSLPQGKDQKSSLQHREEKNVVWAAQKT